MVLTEKAFTIFFFRNYDIHLSLWILYSGRLKNFTTYVQLILGKQKSWQTKFFFFFFFRGNFPGIKFSVEHVEANLFLVCSDPILEAQYTK